VTNHQNKLCPRTGEAGLWLFVRRCIASADCCFLFAAQVFLFLPELVTTMTTPATNNPNPATNKMLELMDTFQTFFQIHRKLQ